jgi:exopolysaccharide production protein ExoZ
MGAMRTVVPIQALRGLGAVSVAISHLHFILRAAGHQDDSVLLGPLASGVDLFFVISGFVMVHSSEERFARQGAWAEFLIARIARIVPLYWLVTVVAIPTTRHPFTLRDALFSFLFVPDHDYTGGLSPLYAAGWTLNFEMFFYFLFAAGVGLQKRSALVALSMLLILIVFSGRLFDPHIAQLQFWSDPIILEFVLGMWIAVLYQRGVTLWPSARLGAAACAIVVVWTFACGPVPSGNRVAVWGLPAAILVAVAVLGPRVEQKGFLCDVAMLFGNASYSIYLIHPLVYSAVIRMWPLGLDRLPLAPALTTAFVSSLCLSVIMFHLFETKTTHIVRRFLNRLWQRRHKYVHQVDNVSAESGRP